MIPRTLSRQLESRRTHISTCTANLTFAKSLALCPRHNLVRSSTLRCSRLKRNLSARAGPQEGVGHRGQVDIDEAKVREAGELFRHAAEGRLRQPFLGYHHGPLGSLTGWGDMLTARGLLEEAAAVHRQALFISCRLAEVLVELGLPVSQSSG
ncbi:hypothetical protein WJX72_002431 [[Myrmecia] bisecta]|uniref:Uncharacterized protein n=1 Tax=[Myrmecia] bisecta TaxID=41462 RepID=A0AAW1PX00_9CHLO